MFDTVSGQIASGTRSLHGQTGCVLLELGIGEATTGTDSLGGQKDECVPSDTGEFVTYMYLGNTTLYLYCRVRSNCLRYMLTSWLEGSCQRDLHTSWSEGGSIQQSQVL